MEKKKELVQELNLDQMDKVSGGAGENVRTCPWCGKPFELSDRKGFHNHVRKDCPNKPAELRVIG